MQGQTLLTIGVYSFDTKYCIGQGSFGKVYKGKNNQTQQIVAIKQLDRSLISQIEINKEIQILKPLAHPNIVKYQAALKVLFFHSSYSQTNEFFYIVTQYCNGGDLRNLLEDSDLESQQQQRQEIKNNINIQGNQKLDKLLDMFFQVCQGFTYLHKFNIIHRDLKPTNILIHNGIYKIADFGLAKTEQLHKSLIHNDLQGVPIYMSPQILSKNFYSYKCDIWSLGVVLYEFYFQKLPWKAGDVNNLFFQIMSNPSPYLNEKKKTPSILKCIFQNTLRYLQKQRMSWQQLLSMQKNRKKIFNNSSKLNQNTNNINSIYSNEINPQSPYSDLSASKISKSIPSFQSQIVHHIICQCQALQGQLISLVGVQCTSTFLNTLRNYLLQGLQYKQCFVDCGFFMLKIAGENLHLYMIDLDYLQEARPLLILLELVHDLITMPPNVGQQEFRKIIGSSYRSSKIDQYAASVISKINTYRLKVRRDF